MDLIRQNKFLSWVIAVLVAMNLLTLVIIWSQVAKPEAPPRRYDKNPQSAPIILMQREIGLTSEQADKYEQLRNDHKTRMKGINDDLDKLKVKLADQVFNPQLQQPQLDSMVVTIGRLQSELELMRFSHFRDLAQICTVEQREKLQPILREVFGRKGQEEKRQERLQPPGSPRPEAPRGVQAVQHPQQPGENRRPPSKEDKLDRLTQRLSLNAEQQISITAILDSTKTKEESYKAGVRPTPDEFEQEKERFRREEDEAIMRVLQPSQKEEYAKMRKNREKR